LFLPSVVACPRNLKTEGNPAERRNLVTFLEVANHKDFRDLWGSMPAVLENERVDSDLDAAEPSIGKPTKGQVMLGSSSLALAAIEAVCLFFVSANGIIVLLGSAAIGLAQGAAWIHTAAIRLPLLGLAAFGALLNLWLLVNAWKLRNAPSARWRKKLLLPNERRRIIFVVVLSTLTLLFVGAELFLHHKLHGSAFAENYGSASNDSRV
jgi:hypothetical protein